MRSCKTAPELQALAEKNPGRLITLEADFTVEESVEILRQKIASMTSTLDQVIYVAGVFIGLTAVTQVGLAALKQNIEVNVYGAYSAAAAFSSFLLKSDYPNRVFVLFGSSFGSITTAKENFDFHNAAFGTTGINATAVYDISKVSYNSYQALTWRSFSDVLTKTAEARLAIEFDLELRPQGVPFLLVHPGLVQTDMNNKGMISVDTSVDGLVNVIGKYSAERKEKFLDYRGEELPW
ncbi:hypothetical protein Asppvi_005366 [Aspergillus pseudoviridinutans]|uniref:NAD(P)-binding protein n=1 Tax=Aspergillus pseudoviridinutans TaxID=1517512 RepID=A0A9P3B828_9EURO|nr:uncharacterized protein Asppvi_005366 [Aspergillus pseudoviridinutans]GIJ86477.1 hypothetical protein Asppvi_005366 [Aspergillus pseudoviridinutans]